MVKTFTLNHVLIPTPVTPRFTSMNLSAHDSPNRERTTNVEGRNLNCRTQHVTIIQAHGMKMQKLKYPFKKIYITSKIHFRISLQDNTSKNLIKYTSFIAGLKYTKSFQNIVFHFPKCSLNIYKISSRPTPQTSPLASPSSGS